MWTLHKQQQHCGAQLHVRAGKPRRDGEAPEEAVADRAAQQHEQADRDAGGGPLQPGAYPASALEHGDSDNTPTAPEAQVDWDTVVQPERHAPGPEGDDEPLPEGK